MAAEWGALPGQLRGRSALVLFHPDRETRLQPIAEAIRLRRRSRFPVEVHWTSRSGAERHGEMTVDLVSDLPDAPPDLLLMLRVLGERSGGSAERPVTSAVEARILALAASGAKTAQIATRIGLTVDGANYYLGRLSRRWGVTGKTALVARAYAMGVLASGTWAPSTGRAEPTQ